LPFDIFVFNSCNLDLCEIYFLTAYAFSVGSAVLSIENDHVRFFALIGCQVK